jgi:hypothetical protein
MSVKMVHTVVIFLLDAMGGQWTPLLGKAEMLRHMPQTGTEPGNFFKKKSLVGSCGVARDFF